jgi:cytochrome c peroxidase
MSEPRSDPEIGPQLPAPIVPTDRLLTAAEFHRLCVGQKHELRGIGRCYERSGPWTDHGQMRRYRPVHGSPTAGFGRPRPYFSDGSAATLLDVVTFYNNRFNIKLSTQDEQDLVNFLKSL